MRSSLLCLCLLASACSPALTIRRLSPPQAVLGTARSVHVQVVAGPTDAVEGEPERVSERLHRLASERLTEVMKAAVDAVVKHFADRLALRQPLREVPLEGGGPLNQGVELLHLGDWAGAVTWFTELTRTQPELDGAWYDLGFALEAQGAWGPALEAYRVAAARTKKPHYSRAVSIAQAVLSSK